MRKNHHLSRLRLHLPCCCDVIRIKKKDGGMKKRGLVILEFKQVIHTEIIDSKAN
jgi:hypothetical protein